MTQADWIYCIFVGYLVLINLITYIFYGVDKGKAQKSQWRIPERTLIGMAWLGGGLGALCGMRHFHHKTLHWRFKIGVPLAFIPWLLLTCSISEVYFLRRGTIYYTPLMLRRQIEAWQNDRHYTYHHHWVSYNEMSPEIVRAVIACEDNLFASHNGFSERGIRNAIDEYKQNGVVKHGGSTISQQTAKNIFTSANRSYLRKIREAWFTVLIEHLWTKQRIMEVYLNSIEMGDGIFGIEAASQNYFRIPASRLNRSQAALIAVCLPNPRKYSVTNPGPYVRKRQQQIIILMPKLGKIDLN